MERVSGTFTAVRAILPYHRVPWSEETHLPQPKEKERPTADKEFAPVIICYFRGTVSCCQYTILGIFDRCTWELKVFRIGSSTKGWVEGKGLVVSHIIGGGKGILETPIESARQKSHAIAATACSSVRACYTRNWRSFQLLGKEILPPFKK
jgi:hypothetical protein